MPARFRSQLERLRKSNNYTQKELASELGVSRYTIADLETIPTKTPTLALARKIARKFEVDVDTIFPPGDGVIA